MVSDTDAGRRDFLQTTGSGATVGAAAVIASVPALSTTVAAFRDARPEHVSLRYDKAEMEEHQPAVIDPRRPRADEQAQRMHGWIAESPEQMLDAYVYFTYYQTQRGTTRFDSHPWDREPIYVFVEPDLMEVRDVSYAAYHYLAAQESSPPTMGRDGEGDHPKFRIIQPHNHYVLSDEADSEFEFLRVDPLGTEDGDPFHPDGSGQTTFEAWLDNGWRDSVEPGVVQNPWRMQTRDSWWADGRETYFVRAWANLQLSMAALGVDNPRIVGSANKTDFN